MPRRVSYDEVTRKLLGQLDIPSVDQKIEAAAGVTGSQDGAITPLEAAGEKPKKKKKKKKAAATVVEDDDQSAAEDAVADDDTGEAAAAANTTLQNVSEADQLFFKKINELVKTYGVGNIPGKAWPFDRGVLAVHKFLQRLSEIPQTEPWFVAASQPLQVIIRDFIKDQQHIQAFHDLITLLKNAYHVELDISSLENLLFQEDSIENLYFVLYSIIRPKLSTIPNIDTVAASQLKKIVMQKDGLHYYRLELNLLQIVDITTFSKLAHVLICSKLLQLPKKWYSETRRNLLSGILDYLYNCKRDSCNIESARNLFFELLTNPETPLAEILTQEPFTAEVLESLQGVGGIFAGAVGSIVGFFDPDSGEQASTTVRERLCSRRFCTLIDNFRSAKDERDDKKAVNLVELKEKLKPWFEAVGFCKHDGGKDGLYPITSAQFAEGLQGIRSAQPDKASVAPRGSLLATQGLVAAAGAAIPPATPSSPTAPAP